MPLAIRSACVEVRGFEHRQHRAEDLLLGDRRPSAARRRRCAGPRSNPRRPAGRSRRRRPAGLLLALLDVAENAPSGLLVDDRADRAAGILGRGHFQAARRLDQPLQKTVVESAPARWPASRPNTSAPRSRRRCATTPWTASSRSASSSTMIAFLPPNSAMTRLM